MSLDELDRWFWVALMVFIVLLLFMFRAYGP